MSLSNHIDVWNRCLSIIRDIVPKEQYETWFQPVRSVSLENSTITLAVPSHFFREYLEEHYIDVLNLVLRREIGSNVTLIYAVTVVEGEQVRLPEQSRKSYYNNEVPIPKVWENYNGNPYMIPGLKKLTIDPQLNPQYSFSTSLGRM